ncbi:taste receptor type 1 member 3-like [Latimeria chalumnae]|uniref:taste receptor type 1 member 3-like n=1 Tax=Latimeria chalumnae TaxID=7897 RepID=UPI00313C648A
MRGPSAIGFIALMAYGFLRSGATEEESTFTRLPGFLQMLAMKFAVEEVNNSSALLRSVKLGYEIHDTCREPVVAMQPAMLFLSQNGSRSIGILCDYADYRSWVAAVIDPSTSELAEITGKLFSFFLIPQISFSATSEKFSDKSLFPSFLRTVPSDKNQVEGMIKLVAEFKWTWIAAIGSDDEYGKQGMRQFSKQASEKGICIAYENFIPVYSSDSETKQVIVDILDQLNKTQVNVVVLFASEPQALTLLEEAMRRNTVKVWIAGRSWVVSDPLVLLPGVGQVGTVIGFSQRSEEVEGFEQYVKNTFAALEQDSPSRGYCNLSINSLSSAPLNDEEDWTIMQSIICQGSFSDNMAMVLNLPVRHYIYNVYLAVYSAAHALHKILNCNARNCQQKSSMYSWQLLEEVKKVQFTLDNVTFHFDKNGNPGSGYDIIVWSMGSSAVHFTKVGQYNGMLVINKSKILWHTQNNAEPQSQCSKECQKGQMKRVKGVHSCCFDCIGCPEGTFHATNDNFECKPCPVGQWSTAESTSCSDPTFLYLSWDHYLTVILLLGMVNLLVLIATISLLFFKHLHSPVVQASGGRLSFFTLFSLASFCCSVCFFFGKPNELICWVQQPYFAISLTACLSTFLAKLLQIMFAAESTGSPSAVLCRLRARRPGLIIPLTVLGQLLICIWYSTQTSPLSSTSVIIRSLSKFIMCDVSPLIGLGLMIGYNGVLALTSFLIAFMVQKPAHYYNLPRDITFAMLGALVAWIVFIPTYAGATASNQCIVQGAVILASSFAMTVAYFLPKCYILKLKPELNTVEYFQIYI